MELRTDYVLANPEDNVSQYVDEMLEDKAIIVKDLFIEGILTKRAFLRSRLDPSQTKVKYFVEKVHIASKKELEEEENKLIKLMIENKWRFIVVGNKTDVKGYVRREDFIQEHLDLFKDLKVRDHMNRELITIRDTDPISKALHIMKFNNIDRLIVLDKDDNLVGIVTLTDILKEVFKPMERAKKGTIAPEKIHELRKPVMEIMSDNPIVIKPSMNLAEAFELMNNNNINSLIVVKENDPTTPVGLITMFDLLLILNKVLNEEEGLEFNIALQNVQLDDFDKEWIKQKLQKILRKYEKIVERASIFIDIKKYKEKLEEYHETDFYHVKIHLIAPGRKIIVESKDDALYTAINKAIKKLDKQLLKIKEEFSEKEVMELLKELAERF